MILHNAVKAIDNQHIYKECGFAEIGHQYTDIYPPDGSITLWMYLTMSYICGDEKLEVSDELLDKLLYILHLLRIKPG